MDSEEFKDAVAYGLGIAMREVEAATYLSREDREFLKCRLKGEIQRLNAPAQVALETP
jgi:hypothetical protein